MPQLKIRKTDRKKAKEEERNGSAARPTGPAQQAPVCRHFLHKQAQKPLGGMTPGFSGHPKKLLSHKWNWKRRWCIKGTKPRVCPMMPGKLAISPFPQAADKDIFPWGATGWLGCRGGLSHPGREEVLRLRLGSQQVLRTPRAAPHEHDCSAPGRPAHRRPCLRKPATRALLWPSSCLLRLTCPRAHSGREMNHVASTWQELHPETTSL